MFKNKIYKYLVKAGSIQFNSFYFESGIYQIDNISLGLVGRL